MVFNIKQPLFGLFYVMTEGVVLDAGFAILRKVILLLFVDVFQVLRVMTSFKYGWTEETTEVFNNVDIVYIFTNLVSKLIPRYSFFILAAVLVIVALGDAYYVVQLFQAGMINKMWPVKILRALVAALVTTLFSSMIKWLLIPIDCIASTERSLSSFIDGDLCEPWSFPEILISIPTILLATCYILFAMTTSFLSFEINPLSRHPMAQYSGRVELCFTTAKVAVTILVYFADLVTPAAVAAVLWMAVSYVLLRHLTILPFHSQLINNVRGGIISMVWWHSFCTFIVACIKTSVGNDDMPSWIQIAQWIMIGCQPLAFVGGCILTWSVQRSLKVSLNRLRGDFERINEISHDKNRSKGMDGSSDSSRHGPMVNSFVKRGAFDKFFDTQWESRRRFKSDYKAINLLHTLLYQRNKDDMAFMQFLIGKALEEHPESQNLQSVQLIFTRFIFRDSVEFGHLHHGMKLAQRSFYTDHQYIMYAAERKNTQEYAGQHLGQGTVSAISLMEFDTGMARARKAHVQCVSLLKQFWKIAKKNTQKTAADPGVEEMVSLLERFDSQIKIAKHEYESLTEKYPQSVSLLRSYGQFADCILNDVKMSEAKLAQANTIENEESKEGREDDEAPDLEQLEYRSGTSSMNEPYRVQVEHFLHQHQDSIMGSEFKAVKRLHRQVRAAVFLLLSLATAGFIITDQYLFNDIAISYMNLIDKTGLFRAYATSSNFLLRSQFLAAINNKTETYAKGTATITTVMDKLRDQHWWNYENLPSGSVKDFYLKEEHYVAYLPLSDSWTERKFNYWNIANDFAHRVTRAGNTKLDEMANVTLSWDGLSEERGNVMYTYEATQKVMIPMFEDMVKLYEQEVYNFGDLTTALVAVNAAINSCLVLLISFFVLRAISRTIATLQYKHVVCCMALSLPQTVASSLHKHYDDEETNMKIIEDEQAQYAEMMRSVGDDGNKSMSNSPMGTCKPWKPATGDPGARFDSSDDGSGVVPHAMGSELKSTFIVAERRHLVQDPSLEVGEPVLTHDFEASVDPLTGRQIVVDSSLAVHDIAPLTEANIEALKDGREDQGQAMKSRAHADNCTESPKSAGSQHEVKHEVKGSIEKWISSTGSAEASGSSPVLESSSTVILVPRSEDNVLENDRHPKTTNEHPEKEYGTGVLEQWECFASGLLRGYRRSIRQRMLAFKQTGSFRRRSEASYKTLSFSGEEILNQEEAVIPSSEPLPPPLPQLPSLETTDTPRASSSAAKVMSKVRRTLSGGTKEKWLNQSEERLVSTSSRTDTREISPDTISALRKALTARRSIYSSTQVYVFALTSILVVCVVGMVWPARHIDEIVNLAPTTNQAGRRRYLTRQCVHFTRELVLNDGLSRLSKEELSSALRYNLEELKRADAAIRLGYDYGVKIGADSRNADHNRVMYDDGCPWRENPEDCATPGRDDVARHGLQYLLLSFYGAVEKVLARYGSPESTYSEAFKQRAGVPEPESYMTIDFDPARLSILKDDNDVSFIMSAFAGDVFNGLGLVLKIFHTETDKVLKLTHVEMRALYAAYLVLVIVFFYRLLFSKTILSALMEANATRNFAVRLPSFVLSPNDVQRVVAFFVPEVMDEPHMLKSSTSPSGKDLGGECGSPVSVARV